MVQFGYAFPEPRAELVQQSCLTIQSRLITNEPSKLNLRVMSPHARLYLRASTSEQDACRARAGL